MFSGLIYTGVTAFVMCPCKHSSIYRKTQIITKVFNQAPRAAVLSETASVQTFVNVDLQEGKKETFSSRFKFAGSLICEHLI